MSEHFVSLERLRRLQRYRSSFTLSNFMFGIEIEILPWFEYNGNKYAFTPPFLTSLRNMVLPDPGEISKKLLLIPPDLSTRYIDDQYWEVRTSPFKLENYKDFETDIRENFEKLNNILNKIIGANIKINYPNKFEPILLKHIDYYSFDEDNDTIGFHFKDNCRDLVNVQFNFTLVYPPSAVPQILDRHEELRVARVLQLLEPLLIPKFARTVNQPYNFGTVDLSHDFFTIPMQQEGDSLQPSVLSIKKRAGIRYANPVNVNMKNVMIFDERTRKDARFSKGKWYISSDFRYPPETPRGIGFSFEVRFTGHIVNFEDYKSFIYLVSNLLKNQKSTTIYLASMREIENSVFMNTCFKAMEEGSENQTVPSDYLKLLENNLNLEIPENTTFSSALQTVIDWSKTL